jgi:hypothetical protein
VTAQPIRCDTGNDDNIAAMMVTNLHDGTVVGLCGRCAPDYLDAVVAAFRKALAEAEGLPADDQPAAAEGDGARRRTRPRRTKVDASPVPTGADDQQAQPTAQDAPAD